MVRLVIWDTIAPIVTSLLCINSKDQADTNIIGILPPRSHITVPFYNNSEMVNFVEFLHIYSFILLNWKVNFIILF